VETVEEEGFQIDVVPFIKIDPVPSAEIKDIIQSLSFQPVTAIFTSVNAAEMVIKELNGYKPVWNLFCIGYSTRNTLTEYFSEDSIAGTGNNASTLALSIIKAGNIKEVVFFCGDLRRDELPLALLEHHIRIKEVIVYKTVSIQNKVTENYRGILFFSPSGVDSFFAHNLIEEETILFAIGDTTAGRLKNYTSNKIITSEGSGKEKLVNTMIAFYKDQKQQKSFN
jgi:uroporphyrinogen-III synthase